MTTWNSDPKWGKGFYMITRHVSGLISGIFHFLVFTFEFQPHTLTFAQIFGNILLYIN